MTLASFWGATTRPLTEQSMRIWLAAGWLLTVLACGSSKDQQVPDKHATASQGTGADKAADKPADKDGLVTVANGKIRVPKVLLDQLRAKESPDLQSHAVKLSILDGSPTLDFLSATTPQLVEQADKGLTQVKFSLGDGANGECTFLNGRARLASWLAAGVSGVVGQAAAIKEHHPMVSTHKGGAIPAVGVQVHYLTHEKLYGMLQVAVFHTGKHGVFCEMDQAAYVATFDRMVTALGNSAAAAMGPAAPRETFEMALDGAPLGIDYRFRGLNGNNLVLSSLEVGIMVSPDGIVGVDDRTVEESGPKGALVKITKTLHVNGSAAHEVSALPSGNLLKVTGTRRGKPVAEELTFTAMRSQPELVDWRKEALSAPGVSPVKNQTLAVDKEGIHLRDATTAVEDATKRTFTVTPDGAPPVRITTDPQGNVTHVGTLDGRGFSSTRLTGGED